MSIENNVINALKKLDIEFIFRKNSNDLWGQVYDSLEFCPVDYLESLIDYQIEYLAMSYDVAVDASLVLLHAGKPCALWRLFLIKNEDNKEYLVDGTLSPLFLPNISKKTIKHLTAKCIRFLEVFCSQSGQLQVMALDTFAGKLSISEWHQQILDKGAHIEVGYDLFVNLKKSIEDIQKDFRKSYKSLINAGRRLWSVEIISGQDEFVWEEFRSLHLDLSGRITRSKETWDLQWRAVRANEAFLITLRDGGYRLIGGALFHTSRDEGVYAVGAYDRSEFDKPVAHIAQLVAIEEMKRRGLSWYRLGERYCRQPIPARTEKEISISMFKQGFATDIYPRYRLNFSFTLPN